MRTKGVEKGVKAGKRQKQKNREERGGEAKKYKKPILSGKSLNYI